jgi:hypothetical protein
MTTTDRFSHERFVEEFGDKYKFIQIEHCSGKTGVCDFCGKTHLAKRFVLQSEDVAKQFGVGRDCCKRHAPEIWSFICWTLGINDNATLSTAVKHFEGLGVLNKKRALINDPALKELMNQAAALGWMYHESTEERLAQKVWHESLAAVESEVKALTDRLNAYMNKQLVA